jgi:2-keto-4-pentenoate hydratase/2-oxohepta-3-ene-1,7-dioic acid hydratase in catechol pathway
MLDTMRIIRFQSSAGSIHYAAQQADGSANLIRGDIFGSYEVTQEKADVAKLLAPVLPTSILCIGLNYRKHAAESGMKEPEHPVLFMKTPATVQNPGDPILLPTQLKSHQVDYECELAVVIGKAAKNVSKEQALDYVLGYTAATGKRMAVVASGAVERPLIPFAHWGRCWSQEMSWGIQML